MFGKKNLWRGQNTRMNKNKYTANRTDPLTCGAKYSLLANNSNRANALSGILGNRCPTSRMAKGIVMHLFC